MNKTVRWIVAVPAAIGMAVFAFLLATLVWNAVRIVNIVPQEGLIDLALANAGASALAAASGVVVGARVAPSSSRTVVVLLATGFTLFAIITLLFGYQFRSSLSMSFGWHVFSVAAWIAGAIGAAYVLLQSNSEQS